LSFQFLLEDGTGSYSLEDSSGNYRLDIPTKVINTTIQVTEAKDNIKTIIRNLSSDVGVTESNNKFTGLVKVATQFLVSVEEAFSKKVTFDVYTLESGEGSYLTEDGVLYKQDIPTKVINSILGINSSSNRLRAFFKNITTDTIGLTEVSQKIEGFVYNVTQRLVNLQTSLIKKVRDANIYDLESGLGSYLLEDDSGFYLIDNLQIIKNTISDTVGLSSLRNQIDGTVHNINETLGLTDILNRLRSQVRNINDTVGLVETIIRARIMFRNITTDNVGITEGLIRARVILRNITVDSIGITESLNRLRSLIREFNEIVGLSETMIFVEGIVKYVSDIVGLTEQAIKFRILGISYNTGDYIAKRLINLSTFVSLSLNNIGDMIRLSSLNSGDMKFNDDD
jgi:hypothetical protein